MDSDLALFDLRRLADYRMCHFVLRGDHAAKPGGDVDLARKLAAMAEERGARTRLTTAATLGRVQPDECLFLLNIDRPFDAIEALHSAPAGTDNFLYALHHPPAGVAKYLRNVGGTKGVLARFADHRPERYEMLVDMMKGAARRDVSRLRAAFRHRSAARTLLSRCCVLVVSPSELESIVESYGRPARAQCLPHPAMAGPDATRGPARARDRRYVLVPGRIEPRKNQRAAILALADFGLKERGIETVVVGGAGSDRAYFDATIRACLDTQAIYVSTLPSDLFFPLVAGASLIVNPSFFEVTSLIDLYAIDNAVPLVTTIHAYYEPSGRMVQIDPESWSGDVRAAREAVDRLLAAPAD